MNNIWLLAILAILIIVCTFIIWLKVDGSYLSDVESTENHYRYNLPNDIRRQIVLSKNKYTVRLAFVDHTSIEWKDVPRIEIRHDEIQLYGKYSAIIGLSNVTAIDVNTGESEHY